MKGGCINMIHPLIHKSELGYLFIWRFYPAMQGLREGDICTP